MFSTGDLPYRRFAELHESAAVDDSGRAQPQVASVATVASAPLEADTVDVDEDGCALGRLRSTEAKDICSGLMAAFELLEPYGIQPTSSILRVGTPISHISVKIPAHFEVLQHLMIAMMNIEP